MALIASTAPAAEAPTEALGDTGHTLNFGVGGAAELELNGGQIQPGVNAFVEWEAIDEWLEFELGASALFSNGGVSVPVDLLAKKPFQLTRWAEFMVGLGPEVVPTFRGGHGQVAYGGEVALDFMFWPTEHVGFSFEPEYDLLFQKGLPSGFGLSGGLLMGW